jgi:hypothetical protein
LTGKTEKPLDFKKHLETAWRLTIRFIAPLILMTLVMTVVSALTLGVLAPVLLAGYIHSVLLAVREGRQPEARDVFSQMKLFFPLLGFALAVLVLSLIGLMILLLPGLAFIFAVTFACLYMLPLMTDQNLGLFQAIRKSYAMAVRESVTDQLVVVIVFLGISAVGNSFFVGWLFTQPLATVFLASVYEEKLKLSGPSSFARAPDHPMHS